MNITYDNVIGTLGLCFSVWAVYAAIGAKKAALMAARATKKQETILDISDVCGRCLFDEPQISYFEVSQKYQDINGDIRQIISYYSENTEEDSVKKILTEKIEKPLNEISEGLITFNPINSEENNNGEEEFYYNQFAVLFTTVQGGLKELMGKLQLIK